MKTAFEVAKQNTFRSDDPVNPNMLVLARVLRGLTQEEVADQSGLPLETLQRYETEGGVLPTHHLYSLSRGFRMPIPFFQQTDELHHDVHLCVHRDPLDDLCAPLQAALDAVVGDDAIANIEWEADGIYVRCYDADEDTVPRMSQKIGNTLLQAESGLRKWLKTACIVSGGEV